MTTQQMVLTVTGMSCGKCAARVEKALRAVSGVSSAQVDLQASEARVTTSTNTDASTLEAAVREAGYGCQRK
jgi:P-type Cu+ transporter